MHLQRLPEIVLEVVRSALQTISPAA